MSILEKDRPKTGRGIWGNAPIQDNDLISGEPTNFSEGMRSPRGTTTEFQPIQKTTEVDMMEVG
jgi:hypothetical protein